MARAQASGTHVAPYAVDGANPNAGYAEVPQLNSAFAVGTSRQQYGQDGYAATLADTLDPSRTSDSVRADSRANLRNPWGWWARFTADRRARESVVFQDADGFVEQKRGPRGRAPDPRWTQIAEDRPTAAMSPHTYVFSRPFDQDIARKFDGSHMSLAVNRRNYDVLTMAPVGMRRNTYRTEPTPWDSDIVDETPDVNQGLPQARLQSPNLPPTNRTYRL